MVKLVCYDALLLCHLWQIDVQASKGSDKPRAENIKAEITCGNSASKKRIKTMDNSFVVLSVLLLLEFSLENEIPD